MTFDEVIGQADAKARLAQLIDEDRIPHAMLLCGPTGCGKMAIALALASRLLNDSPLLRHWGHPDLHFTFPTIKLPGMGSEHQPVSNDFISEWREMLSHGPYFSFEQWMAAMKGENQQAIITGGESDALTRKLSMRSNQGGYKVSIIWLPERMNPTSANKLLKLIEEPPLRTVFIMVSEAPEQLLDTIRSRTQRIDLKRIADNDIAEALIAKRGIEPDTARRVARVAHGSWLAALQALDAGNENRLFFDLYAMLMRMAYGRRLQELKKWSESVAAFGREKQKRMLAYFNRMTRENFMYNFRAPELNYMTEEEERFATNFSPFVNEANIISMSELLEKAQHDIGRNTNAKIVFFDLALQMIILLRLKA